MSSFISNSQLFIPLNNHEDTFTSHNSENNSHLRNINQVTAFDSNRVKRRKRDSDCNGQNRRSVPWKKRDQYSPSVVGLHEEINDFYDALSPTLQEKEVRLRVVHHVQQTVHSLWPQARVNVFGSFNTGLYLPTSDIDIVVTGKWDTLPLNTLRTALVSSGINDSDIFVLSNATVPLVRFVHSFTRIKVDISFNVQNGLKSAELIKNSINMFPVLPKLVLVLKQFLVQRNLNEVYHGGMSSYSLTLLVISFLQGHHRPKSIPVTNLGTLLLEFFELYGINFNYEKVCISVRNGGYYCPKRNPWGSYLSIEDPFCEGNDIAKGTFMMQDIKGAFENAYNILHKALTETQDSKRQSSILKLIISVDTNIFIQRQWLVDNFDEVLKSFHFDLRKDSKSKDWKENISESFLPSVDKKEPEIIQQGNCRIQSAVVKESPVSKDIKRPVQKTRIFYGSRQSLKNPGVDRGVNSGNYPSYAQVARNSYYSSNENRLWLDMEPQASDGAKQNFKSKRQFKQMTNQQRYIQ